MCWTYFWLTWVIINWGWKKYKNLNYHSSDEAIVTRKTKILRLNPWDISRWFSSATMSVKKYKIVHHFQNVPPMRLTWNFYLYQKPSKVPNKIFISDFISYRAVYILKVTKRERMSHRSKSTGQHRTDEENEQRRRREKTWIFAFNPRFNRCLAQPYPFRLSFSLSLVETRNSIAPHEQIIE